MHLIWNIIFVIFYMTSFFLIINGLLFWQQQRIFRTQLKDFDIDINKYILIEIQLETEGGWRERHSDGGKANMYFKDDLIFISPRLENSFFDFLKPRTIPKVFTKDINKIKTKTKIGNVFVPNYIQVGENGSIEIQYRYNPLVRAKDYCYISVIEKDKLEDLSKIKEWWNS